MVDEPSIEDGPRALEAILRLGAMFSRSGVQITSQFGARVAILVVVSETGCETGLEFSPYDATVMYDTGRWRLGPHHEPHVVYRSSLSSYRSAAIRRNVIRTPL